MNDDPRLDHRRAWDAIPWVVNGSAGDAEHRLVRAHVEHCEDCRDELAFQQRLHRGIGTGAAPARDPSPALQRLWARIDRIEGDTDARAPGGARAAAGPGWTRLLAAAVVVQAIALVALVGLLRERSATAPYQTLSSVTSAAAAAPAGSVRMVPATRLSIGELQAVLERAQMRIVHTSDDGAILTLAPRASARLSAAQALATLRAEPNVRLAEPIVADAAARP